jgi:hypothetical protein
LVCGSVIYIGGGFVFILWYGVHRVNDDGSFFLLGANHHTHTAADAIFGDHLGEDAADALYLYLPEAFIETIFQTIHTAHTGLKIDFRRADHSLLLLFEGQRRDGLAGTDLSTTVAVVIAVPTYEGIHDRRPHGIPTAFEDGG